MNRNEPWLVSASGKCISVEHPTVNDIDLFDVANGLAAEQRYGNRLPTNVAHHSCMVAELASFWAVTQKDLIYPVLPEQIALVALFHDASEAYLGDVISPVKKFLPDYEKLEKDWMTVCSLRFGFDLSLLHHRLVKDADRAVHLCEVFFHAEYPTERYAVSQDELDTFIPMYIRQCKALASLEKPWAKAEATFNFLNYCYALNVK
jgi:hypothetical protein